MLSLAVLGFLVGLAVASQLQPGRGKLIVLLLAAAMPALPLGVAAVRGAGPRRCVEIHHTWTSRARCAGAHGREGLSWFLLAAPGLVVMILGTLQSQPEAAAAGLSWFAVFGLIALARRPRRGVRPRGAAD